MFRLESTSDSVRATPREGMRHVAKKKRTNREFIFQAKIDNYKMYYVILNLGSDVNILPKTTSEQMGKLRLV